MNRYGNVSAVAGSMLNFIELSKISYPGRGIIVGTSQCGKFAIQVYWIMGRSDNSRNRIFQVEGSRRVFTEPADASKVKDASLIIYNAMDSYAGNFVVSNGDQTNTAISAFAMAAGITLREALRDRTFEPDRPNFTPRITGLCVPSTDGMCFTQLSIIRKSELAGDDNCERACFDYVGIRPGYGFSVSTYEGDGDPLPAFNSGPYPLPLVGGMEDIAETYWSILNKDNRVSLAVKFITIESRDSVVVLRNRYSKVQPAPIILA